jgi:undecaprenyl-diphosphatase
MPVRVVMQAGTVGTVPVAAGIAVLAGRRRLASSMLIGGITSWFGAKLAKPYGGRPRPAALLDRVRIRETIAGDLGWVSGHTAVATTLALTAADALPAAARPVLGGVVALTGFGRMYVGAHLPHDLVGGLGLGMMISSVLPTG